MKTEDITALMARHILERGDLDSLISTTKKNGAGMDFLDHVVLERRNAIMGDLEDLKLTAPEEIHQAFKTFGSFETMFYLQDLAGSHQLTGHRNLYMAALKLDDPDKDWNQIEAETSSIRSLQLKQPQMVIGRKFSHEMNRAISKVKDLIAAPSTIPYMDDRLYLNAILCADHNVRPRHVVGEALKTSGALFEFVLERCEQIGKPLIIDEELYFSGILALGCMTLPGFDSHSQEQGLTGTTLLQPMLTSARSVCIAQGTSKDVADISGLIARVEHQINNGSELLRRPFGFAFDTYSYILAEKVGNAIGRKIVGHKYEISGPILGPT